MNARQTPPPSGPQEEGASPKLSPWDAFISATTADARSHAWLALVCDKIPGAQAAAVLVDHPKDQTFAPLAVWPQASPDLGRLGPVVEMALRERRGVVQPLTEPAGLTQIAYPLMQDERVAAVVALEVTTSDQVVGLALREIHWASAWLINLLAGRALFEATRAKERVGSVLEVTAVALRHGQLRQALFEVANTLRQHFDCTRVAMGLVADARVRLSTLSEAAVFEKHASLVKAYEQAMDEAYDEGRPIRLTLSGQGDGKPLPEASATAWPQHHALGAISGAAAVLSFPLMVGAETLGVLTLERAGKPFSDEDLVWLDAFSALVAPILAQRQAAEQGLWRRLVRDARQVLDKIFGPRHLIWKAGTAAVLLLCSILVLVPISYRVAAKTVIEGEIQRIVAAPFEGFIASSQVRAGDRVRAGQVLAQLDDRELRIEEAKWSSERDQYDNRLREAMANHDLTAMQVVDAQLRQSSAQLALVTDKIARARLSAPFDGIVVSGDLTQQVGAPVESGKKLFEIAPLQSYRIILQVDEREIRHLRQGQPGRLVMTGIAGEPMDFTVTKITPVATAQEGRNFFRVEASLADASPRLQPGMEGIGKIEAGEHSLWWVLTHTFTEWLTLSLWSWLP